MVFASSTADVEAGRNGRLAEIQALNGHFSGAAAAFSLEDRVTGHYGVFTLVQGFSLDQ